MTIRPALVSFALALLAMPAYAAENGPVASYAISGILTAMLVATIFVIVRAGHQRRWADVSRIQRPPNLRQRIFIDTIAAIAAVFAALWFVMAAHADGSLSSTPTWAPTVIGAIAWWIVRSILLAAVAAFNKISGRQC